MGRSSLGNVCIGFRESLCHTAECFVCQPSHSNTPTDILELEVGSGACDFQGRDGKWGDWVYFWGKWMGLLEEGAREDDACYFYGVYHVIGDGCHLQENDSFQYDITFFGPLTQRLPAQPTDEHPYPSCHLCHKPKPPPLLKGRA